jgi:hypothetical protein
LLGNEKLREACDALKAQGKPVFEVNYEDLVTNTSECMEQICRFLEIPFEAAVTSLAGADRSAISGGHGEHHALLRLDRIVGQRNNAEILSEAKRAKIDRYICRWKKRYGDQHREYTGRLPQGTRPPGSFELWYDRIACQSDQVWDNAVTLIYAITPIALARWWRSRSWKNGV